LEFDPLEGKTAGLAKGHLLPNAAGPVPNGSSIRIFATGLQRSAPEASTQADKDRLMKASASAVRD
jgi:hypothetical protein